LAANLELFKELEKNVDSNTSIRIKQEILGSPKYVVNEEK